MDGRAVVGLPYMPNIIIIMDIIMDIMDHSIHILNIMGMGIPTHVMGMGMGMGIPTHVMGMDILIHDTMGILIHDTMGILIHDIMEHRTLDTVGITDRHILNTVGITDRHILDMEEGIQDVINAINNRGVV